MTFFFHDMAGLVLGTLIALLLGVLPGFAIAQLLERVGLKTGRGWERVGWALILAFSVLPAVEALVIRYGGTPAAFSLRVALALAALPALFREMPHFSRIPRALFAFGALWWLVVAIATLDVDWDGRLYQSLVVVDLVKHAAVVETIAHFGVPLRDTFFARAQPAGYYYYFYCLPAEIRWIAGDLVSARMAFVSTLLWAGLAFPAMIWRVGADAGLIARGQERRFLLAAVFLCFIAGADVPFVLLENALSGVVLPQAELWGEEVRFALTSMVWVPHHMTALLACWASAVLLCRVPDRTGRTGLWLIGAAGLCFGSAFGMSLWIALTATPVFGAWAAVRLWRGGRAAALAVVGAGLVAAIVCLPQIGDILHGRGDQTFPIGLTIRSFAFWWVDPKHPSILTDIFLLLMLPVGYAIQFGAFAVGGVLFLRAHPGEAAQTNGLRSLLVVSAIVSFLVASFLASTIINNDLGWRSIWFAQVPAMVWTASVIHAQPTFFMKRAGFRILLLLGIAGNLWDMAGFRFIRPPLFHPPGVTPNNDPTTDFAEREAYEWAAHHLDAEAVIQHNPTARRRAFDFGLYGRNRPAVADKDANLFGASKEEVMARIQTLQPIFDTPLPLPDMQARARAEGVDILLLADTDPAWKRQAAPAFLGHCLYRNQHVCLLPTKGAAS